MSHFPELSSLEKCNSVHEKQENQSKPTVVESKADFEKERKVVLEQEKAVSRLYDRMLQQRRKLSWLLIKKDYKFTNVEGKEVSFSSLIPADKPVIVQYIMTPTFDGFEKSCSMCSLWTDGAAGFAEQLSERAEYICICNCGSDQERFKKIVEYKKWPFKIFNAGSEEFGRDFDTVSNMKEGEKTHYNFKDHEEPPFGPITELPGYFVFARDDQKRVCLTYSCFSRGLEQLTAYFNFLDMLPGGRNGFMPRHKQEIQAEKKETATAASS